MTDDNSINLRQAKHYVDVEIDFLNKQIDEIKEELKEIRKESHKILEFVYDIKAGKRYLTLLVSFAIGIGALVDQVIRYVRL